MADVVGRPDRETSPVLGRSARRGLALGLVLAAAAAAWVWTGLHPSVSSQGLLGVRGLPGAVDTAPAWVVGPTGTRLLLELRNTGDLPFTARATTDGRSPVPVEGAVRLLGEGRADLGSPARSVTVDPGGRAHLLLRASLLRPYCPASGTATDVVLTVRTLGLPTTQRLSLPRPVQVAAPPRACR